LFHDTGRVRAWLGARHREHRRVSAERSRRRTGLHGLGVFSAGFAQVRVQVDQTGQQHRTLAVDNVVRRGRPHRSELSDDAVLDPHIELCFPVWPHVAEHERIHACPFVR
jgi:hypothetical protein